MQKIVVVCRNFRAAKIRVQVKWGEVVWIEEIRLSHWNQKKVAEKFVYVQLRAIWLPMGRFNIVVRW